MTDGTPTRTQAQFASSHTAELTPSLVGATYSHRDIGLSDEQVRAMYRLMLLQRRFEEAAAKAYGERKISGFLHLYIGQEAVSTAAEFAIRPDDYVISAYRDHGIALARGVSARACMAELFGKVTGCSRGKGGSMHYFSKEHNFLGGHGIVGGQIPIGTGVAWAIKYRGEERVCLTFMGDGAVAQGVFHESLNMAMLWRLPVVYIIENNEYGMGTAVSRAHATPDLARRALAYGMPSAQIDGMNVFEVYRGVKEAVERARREHMPSLLEVKTYRYRGHSMSDPGTYRTKEEVEAHRKRDPIVNLRHYMLEAGLATEADLEAIEREVRAEIEDAVAFAESSPLPPIESLYEDVYTDPDYPFLA
ncbi:MAG: pyruvate dehydrogenase (acetyl-transferring) E1 component subunit alpha [Bacteroidetes bacterium]|nr:pyruvate dehydrogenase (acetyl-transferring) E1 component subunit alpha [Rhodothermia bacterium]MCS7155166.1 pyruvate dehydrogenase (acetyl-transferring) E1 component subunit alpha [Bacteroidota bacterium]MCX7906207.1 pyruvate dehydrogenase (acetyl-transferring) E1 component subunit alpha [Bacteroidota bacterium]MDW8138334.1 pyruvate dehydrogenase (acetyl-transferring) E1 component subunit alpha [Bacteroidota bacterium]MDW8286019.1 pyruvate dehydrogenase (acetyl-transferring) E1 component su